jgi:HSP20 family molecular chaperone IbpA
MASDIGTAKAKETTKDNSSQRDNRQNTSSPVQNNSSTVQRDTTSESGKGTSFSAANFVNVPVNPEDRRLHHKLNSELADRAYQLYEQNGARHGDDLFHWLQAESELLTRIPGIQQTDTSYFVVTPLGGFSAEEMSVTVEPNRAFILADKKSSHDEDASNNSNDSFSSRRSAFFVTDWPSEVDPATATAQIRQGRAISF